jgi:flagellar hook-length control protein FliK
MPTRCPLHTEVLAVITAILLVAATARLTTPQAPAVSAAADLRAGNADDGHPGAFPLALQRSVDEPAPVPARPARAVADPTADREPQASTNVRAPRAVGDDTDKLLAELDARHGLRTKIASEDLSRTPPAYGLKSPPVAPRSPEPASGGIVLPPTDGDPPVLAPPFHDQPGAPMPRVTAAEAEPAPAARRSARSSTTAPVHGGSATPPEAGSKAPLGRSQPAVPRPRSDADQSMLKPLQATGDAVLPSSDGETLVSAPPVHDQPGAPMPRDPGAEAAQVLAGPAEIRAPDLGAGLDTAPRSSLTTEAPSAGGERGATELTAEPQADGQVSAAVAPAAANTAAQPASWPGPGQATVAGIAAPAIPAADDEFARPANEAGSTPFALSLPMGQALAPAGLSTAMATATATGTPAEARLMAAPGSADFSSQLGAQLTTFVREGVQHARLYLHPAELGPVTVRIQIDGQSAQVHMAAEHALTRQALEQSMPVLAGSLREAGLTLSGGGVFEQPRQRDGGDAPGQPGAGPGNTPGGDRSPETPPRAATMAPARRGVVDLVA